MRLRSKFRDWNDARAAENFARTIAQTGASSVKALNEKLVKAVLSHKFRVADAIVKAGGSPDASLPYKLEYQQEIYSYPLLTEMIRREDAAAVEFLIGANADVNRIDTHNKQSPLIEAAIVGSPRIVRMLLDAGAEMCPTRSRHYSDYPVRTAFDIADARGYKDIVKMVRDEPSRRQQAEKDRITRLNNATAEKVETDPPVPECRQESAVAFAAGDPASLQTGKNIKVAGPLRLKPDATKRRRGPDKVEQ